MKPSTCVVLHCQGQHGLVRISISGPPDNPFPWLVLFTYIIENFGFSREYIGLLKGINESHSYPNDEMCRPGYTHYSGTNKCYRLLSPASKVP